MPKPTLRRRQWHPTPVFLPGKSHGWRSLVGCSPWGREESDMTERLHFFSLFTSMHWRRKWQPTPVFFPGESQGQGSLVGCRLWVRTLCPEVTREQPTALCDKLNGRLDFLGQHKRKPEFPVVTRESRRISRKTTCFPRHRNMRPLPATASPENSHVPS